jgi:hypothetical protein
MSNVEKQNTADGVPVPVVTFSRWVYAVTLVLSLVFQFSYGVTILLVLLLPGLLFGKKWNLIGRVGKKLLKNRIPGSETEDARLLQFNNWLLVFMLLAAQVAFIAGLKVTAWVIVVAVIIVTGVALSGFCVGCFLYYHFKLYRYKFSINN